MNLQKTAKPVSRETLMMFKFGRYLQPVLICPKWLFGV
ncbi:uncharacterized protein METZ01_LOCUS459012 [marine metagenome]|uniref:Uncharacterized protein n=1 Tax=marine metagenome TaxID=408172 RepID=A0A383AGE7_9ZZZZ